MTTQQDNIVATQNLFTAFGAGDIPGILDFVNDDLVIEFYGPPVIPYAGTYTGRSEAQRFFETVLSSVEINQFEPQEMLADADKVIVTGHLNLKAISTGRIIDSDFVHVITLSGAKWSRFRDFMDTSVAVAAFSS
jgi:ketosteroid isomerase-like protein